MNYALFPYTSVWKDDIIKVWEKSVLATHHFLSPADFLAIKSQLQAFDFSLLNTFCLLQEQAILGFMAIHEDKLEMLFIAPEYIGKGLGKFLIDIAKSEFNINTVDVNEQNFAARRFYEKMGFKVYARSDKDEAGRPYPILKMRLSC